MRVGASLLLLVLAACPGGTEAVCSAAPGCPGKCCNGESLCQQQICNGAGYTCISDGSGHYAWVRGGSCPNAPDGAQPDGPGTDGSRTDGPRPHDARPPDRPGCVCNPGQTQPCGPCNKGTKACKADCSGFEAQCQLPAGVCQPAATEVCPNDCGDRTCSSSCAWGDCSKAGQLVKAGQACWSSNHCSAGSPGGTGRCVACWIGCNGDGSTYEDAWCAGSCQSCSPIMADCNSAP